MAEELRTEVCIIGAGPGGCAAALQLAKNGVSAIVIDKAVFPRDKVCGDALSGKVMRVLERLDPTLAMKVKTEPHRMPSWGVTFVAPGGRALRVPFSEETGHGEAPGAILPRYDFDNLLFQQVKAADGITVIEGRAAESYERNDPGWEISLGDGHPPVHARLIIDASGANSRFARNIAGLKMRPRHHAAGVRAYFRGVEGLDPDGFIELHFLKEILPGYLWVFPLPNGRANVGLGLRSDLVKGRKLDLKNTLFELLRSHPRLKDRFASAKVDIPVQGMGLPLASKRRLLSGDGYLLVGDAGHLIDPFTGEGISHAMISGVYAADQAAEAITTGRFDAGSLKAYDARVWKRLGKELAISTRLQKLADKPWLFDLVVDRANKNPAFAATIGSMFTDIDLRERLKRPGFYMDLLLGRKARS